jgi:hypothetical protein
MSDFSPATTMNRPLGSTLNPRGCFSRYEGPTMNFVSPDTCLQDYKKCRSAFLQHL